MSQQKLVFHPKIITHTLFFIVMMWVSYYANWRWNLDWNQYGIYPREISGLLGILFSPFLHGDISHLTNNTLAIVILFPVLYFFYPAHATRVILLGWLISGFGTWLIGRPSFHIGASGIVYVLTSFIFFYGMRIRYYRLMAVSFFVVLIYGSSVWYMFPDAKEGISWEGHLSGFMTGFILSYTVPKLHYESEYKYAWQHPDFDESKDDFIRQFDKNGTFDPLPMLKIKEGYVFNETYHRKNGKGVYSERFQL